jgi:hypothetical protein
MKLGNCWENSLHLVLRHLGNPGIRVPVRVWKQFQSLLTPKSKVWLIHGRCKLPVGWIKHGWVEIQNPRQPVICVHWQFGSEVHVRPDLGRTFQRISRRYTPTEASTMVYATGTTGPWSVSRVNAQIITLIKLKKKFPHLIGPRATGKIE